MTKPYAEMTKDEKRDFIQKTYVDEEKSFYEAAELGDTYPNRLRRDAVAFNFEIRDRSAAQTKVLKTGRAQHATEGKKHSEATREKISEKRAAAWDAMSPEDREKVSEAAKEQWDKMSPEDVKRFRQKASEAVRRAAKDGSKLEKYLLRTLTENNFHAEVHKEQILVNERLHLDLYLPRIGVAIEVDGPSHFLPIWGNKTLQRNKKSDSQKNGLLLSKGLILIRIKQVGALTEKTKREIGKKLLDLLNKIVEKKPELGNRYFEI